MMNQYWKKKCTVSEDYKLKDWDSTKYKGEIAE